jgi:peptide/nickel transport system substrate-binding protein
MTRSLHEKKSVFVFVFIGSFLLSSFPWNNATAANIQNSQSETRHFRVGTSETNLLTLDPVLFSGGSGHEILTQVVETLITTDFPNGQQEYVPFLAENYTWINSTTLKLSLRQNVTFHDGTPFNASVAQWNFDRIDNLMKYHAPVMKTLLYVDAVFYRDDEDSNVDWVPEG